MLEWDWVIHINISNEIPPRNENFSESPESLASWENFAPLLHACLQAIIIVCRKANKISFTGRCFSQHHDGGGQSGYIRAINPTNGDIKSVYNVYYWARRTPGYGDNKIFSQCKNIFLWSAWRGECWFVCCDHKEHLILLFCVNPSSSWFHIEENQRKETLQLSMKTPEAPWR